MRHESRIFQFLKRILRYIKGTLHYGLTIKPSGSTKLTAYSDADWGDAPILDVLHPDFVFISVITLSHGPQNVKQPFLALARRPSTVELLTQLLKQVGFEICCLNLVFPPAMQPLFTVIIFLHATYLRIRSNTNALKVQVGVVRVLHIPAEYQYAYIFTKGLPKFPFQRFRSSLCIRPATAQTAGDC